MATGSQFPAARRSELLEYIQETGYATVVALSQRYGVSKDTIRRDIDALSDEGLVERSHGGVIAGQQSGRTIPVSLRAIDKLGEKRAIGAATAELINSGETLFIGGGTTALAVAHALRHQRHLTIITNNLLVPNEIDQDVADELWIVGGQVRDGAMSTYGLLHLPGISTIKADKAIVGVSGVSLDSGFSISAPGDAMVVREMITHSKTPIIVADSSKFGRDALASAASFSEVSGLVTNRAPDEALTASLEAAGVQIWLSI